jgi:hypothetical protein
MPTHLRPSDYRVMPWKNGQGRTTEIAVHPPGAGLEAFTWRLSIADLAASGPFSTFAGHDRILVQLEGAPMTLAHEGRGEHRLMRLGPHRFAGEWPTHGALEAPPARDFNVMVRRAEASADLAVHRLEAGGTVAVHGEAETRLAYVHEGSAAVRLGDETCALAAGDTLVAADAAGLTVTAAPGGATVFVIAIGPSGRYAAPS